MAPLLCGVGAAGWLVVSAACGDPRPGRGDAVQAPDASRPQAGAATVSTDASALEAAVPDADAAVEHDARGREPADGGELRDAQADGAAGVVALPPPLPATSLPLEVLGPPGSGVEVSIELDDAQLAAARRDGARLALTLHNVLRPDSAQVSLNGGPLVDLGAERGPFLRRFDGRVSSGEIALDPALLRAGDNRIVFRYTRQVFDLAAVSGFRVLALAIAIGEQAIATALPEDEPASWQAPHDDPEAIERGRSYFRDQSRDGGPPCARCHADSGADLQYYAFSSFSLIERAMFHELSRREAEELASYIRSLPLAPIGRPWDPPFQPGPGNHGATGAGYEAILADDAAFARAALGAAQLPDALPWAWPEDVDTFAQPTATATPSWLRWLPRELHDEWFERRDGSLAAAERALAAAPTLENAQAFMSAALAVAKELFQENGDHLAKIELMRFAAVKLWDWSRRNGFERADHGVPDASPAYPYEVGFAFFEAALSGAVPGAMVQTMDWWWVQLAVNPGRGLSTGRRPLDFHDVLRAADAAGLGPAHLAFLHVYGSWEESRGALADEWGSAGGPVRLLDVPMRRLAAADRARVLRRFLEEESARLAEGVVLDAGHRAALAQAWSAGCDELTPEQRASLRALAPQEVREDLAGCGP